MFTLIITQNGWLQSVQPGMALGDVVRLVYQYRYGLIDGIENSGVFFLPDSPDLPALP